jgi:hypothetical protein
LAEAPFAIRVPLVTRKERHYLDACMPCKENWSPPAFEMTKDEIRDYRTIHAYYPSYTEMLL